MVSRMLKGEIFVLLKEHWTLFKSVWVVKEDPGLGSYVGAISAISGGFDRMGPYWVGKWGDPIGSLWTPEETFGYFEIFGKSIFLAKNGHISAPCGPNPLKFGYVICPSVEQLSINRPSPSMNFAKNPSGQKLALGGPKMPLKPWNHKICWQKCCSHRGVGPIFTKIGMVRLLPMGVI